jgi:hypothetical protein
MSRSRASKLFAAAVKGSAAPLNGVQVQVLFGRKKDGRNKDRSLRAEGETLNSFPQNLQDIAVAVQDCHYL